MVPSFPYSSQVPHIEQYQQKTQSSQEFKKKLSLREIQKSYELLELETEVLNLSEEFTSYDSEIDRFNDMTINKTTLVKTENMGEGYQFNANRLRIGDRSIIATQYPYKELGHYYFWQMSLEQGSLIVDLTSPEECQIKSLHCYYPTEINPEIKFNNLTISYLDKCSLSQSNYLHLLTYQIFQDNFFRKEIQRIHFEAWPDYQDAPFEEVIQLLKTIRHLTSKLGGCPIIHCRAGVGRTGVLSTLLVLTDAILKKQIVPQNLLQKINQTILEGRKQRHRSFVQNENQYLMVAKICEKIISNLEILSPYLN